MLYNKGDGGLMDLECRGLAILKARGSVEIFEMLAEILILY